MNFRVLADEALPRGEPERLIRFRPALEVRSNDQLKIMWINATTFIQNSSKLFYTSKHQMIISTVDNDDFNITRFYFQQNFEIVVSKKATYDDAHHF